MIQKENDVFIDIEKSYFDEVYYKNVNLDLNLHDSDLFMHYHTKGWKEHRNPNKWFSVDNYLSLYGDVERANIDPFYHYLKYGIKEKRTLKKVGLTYEVCKDRSFTNTSNDYAVVKILIIGNYYLEQCKLYRVDEKLNQLYSLGYHTDVFDYEDFDNCFEAIQTAKIVIFYRVPSCEKVDSYYREAERLNLYTVYDIDDLIFDELNYSIALSGFELDNKLKKHLLDDAKLFAKCLKRSNEVWVSTVPLQKIVVSNYNKNCKVIPNGINHYLLEEMKISTIKSSDNDNIVKIFYGTGTNTHDRDLNMIMDALEYILDKHSNVHLYIIGEIKPLMRRYTVLNQIHIISKVSYNDYYYMIHKYDIAVIPLEDSVFNSCKSNIKYIEASALKVASVASNLIEYKNLITNGFNGYLAANCNEWKQYLDELVSNPLKRKEIADNAFNTVISSYTNNVISVQIFDSLTNKISNTTGVCNKTKIMLVNVLYGVSSFGGATVVTEQLAKSLSRDFNYAVTVFTTHSDKDTPLGRIRRYDWDGGVSVISLNVSTVSANYYDEGIGRIFEKILLEINPALVHFHCIQTLGVCLPMMCLKNNVKYFITMHDGWWRCPRIFLIDNDGQYCADKELTCELCKNRCNISNAEFVRRIHFMESILSKACAVYTPSYFFSNLLHRDFPFVKILTNKNGILDVHLKNHQPHVKSSKIVFGYFGGKDIVKGFDFVQKVLNKKNPKDFSLVVIDTALRGKSSGLYSLNDFVFPYKIYCYKDHEKMKNMYEMINVLLFPSKWKESFGLIVREAIANNVFVIASKCGGPSEAIVQDENGMLFDFNDINQFESCIDKVLNDKEKYINYTTKNYGDVISFSRQAGELHKEYSRFLTF